MIQATIIQHTRARLKPLRAPGFGRDCVLANDGPDESGVGRYRAGRMRRTTSLLMGMPKANAMLGDPRTAQGRIPPFHIDRHHRQGRCARCFHSRQPLSRHDPT